MNIFNFINMNSPELCIIKNELYIEEGRRIRLHKEQNNNYDIEFLRVNYGDNIKISISFIGELLIKFGISAEGKSFIWCGEKTIKSYNLKNENINVDINKCSTGELEIFIYAIKESIICNKMKIPVNINIDQKKVLYDFMHPTFELCCEEQLYYRFFGDQAYYSFENNQINLRKNSSVDLLTYFNAFSAVKWKKYTNIECLSVYLDFMGEARAEIIHICGRGKTILGIWHLKANHRTKVELPIGRYPNTGLIGIQIYTESEYTLFGGGYLADAPETQSVRLGIGITTYHRENAVKKSVKRLIQSIKSHELYSKIIDITVIDNGGTLVKEEFPSVNIISNKNLGGTGGFMRSLIYYKDTGNYTHCLFMDDDASCEIGSIFRSISFLKHVNDPTIAISGAMLSENIQFIQWENGAWFDSCCHPIHCNYDLRDINNLLKNEDENIKHPIYGAWWYFMFPINYIIMYSFPFFVRGDDIEFSYTNNFKIIRMNGIAVWQEDFKTKESPMTLYLDMRSHILHHILLEHICYGRLYILKMVWSFFKRFNLSYQYDTANAIISAFSNILQGPQYWIDNIDISKIREKINNNYKIEHKQKLRENYLEIPEANYNMRFRIGTKFIRVFTQNGHLLPRFFVNKKLWRLNKFQTPFINRMFLRDKVLIYNKIDNSEVVLKRDSVYFYKNILLLFVTSIRFMLKYIKLKKEYEIFFCELKDDNFWKKMFNS